MDAMDTRPSPNLETLVSLWPVAISLSQHLPAGDLITLSRSSASLRALLHGFGKPQHWNLPADPTVVRGELNIGRHGTLYWQQLKNQAPFECSSRTHTKGPTPKPCRYCSKPICDACIVRSSFARGHENTFQNRTRSLCEKCWEGGNPSQSERFLLNPPHDAPSKRKWYDPDGSTKDYCTCTLKDDGWLCLECKDLQNWEAMSSAVTVCHGKDCREPLDDEKERRRICLWCNKALPRQIGGTTRYHWNQKMIEAKARNAASRQADLEEYNRRRLKLTRMSRRELRGDEAVKDDPDADVPQFVRHLDTLNYRSYMTEAAAPSGDSVYNSKRGYWRYSTNFLLEMRSRCTHVPVPAKMRAFTPEDQGALTFARTNGEFLDGLISFSTSGLSMSPDRVEEWWTLKAVILEVLLVQKLGYEAAQRVMQEEYGFYATVKEYRQLLRLWYAQRTITQHRRRSIEEEGDSAKLVETLRDRDSEPVREPIIVASGPIVVNGPATTEDLHDSQRHLSTGGTSIPLQRALSAGTDVPSDHGGAGTDTLGDLVHSGGPEASEPGAAVATISSEAPPLAEDPIESILPPLPPPISDSELPTLEVTNQTQNTVAQDDENPPPYAPDGWIWP
ncbi:hypothetical protein A1O1_06382 [Capronia coronata CBS 617.96]|uniref:Clr5 domain-containing protein n=1 Tax=Capronia coronata CBS 617.96 TaxID=1182541 RepID=W9Y0L0_9EURO|nr:uncharacterized protein A1O1_06382 [Capronia coronata CBS 617.96]EXJ86013.1 hypothetical protein A1O1_06382 [Capronia coronata CBS 617.96]